ncbi:MAG: class I SAM-dependent methyltransferase [Rhodocyclaceae bacterium]|nr:class I SAM-dependent methyltransferase [Rhodocyclaceae bacterium]
MADIRAPALAVDLGAGTGRVSLALAAQGWQVDAVEPCREMHELGAGASTGRAVRWHRTTGEATGLASGRYRIACFGSSLNVMDRAAALAEARRLVGDGGNVLCAYNHRCLDDPLQREIQRMIERLLGHYDAGERRGDAAVSIADGGCFGSVRSARLAFVHSYASEDFVDAFRAHATLVRQAGDRLDAVLGGIRGMIAGAARVEVPFETVLSVGRAL